jgi:hypothetical protein
MRGEPRSARPAQPRCRFFLLAQVCPTAMLLRLPHLRGLRLRSVVRINVHGPPDRVKDASPCVCAISCAHEGAYAWLAHADDVPLLGALRTSVVIGAFRSRRIPVT